MRNACHLDGPSPGGGGAASLPQGVNGFLSIPTYPVKDHETPCKFGLLRQIPLFTGQREFLGDKKSYLLISLTPLLALVGSRMAEDHQAWFT